MTHRISLLLCATLLSGCAAQAPRLIENGLGMRFVRLPAGEFLMGSAESPETLARDFPALDEARFRSLGDEAPIHRVRITRDFYLGQHEVTVGQFRRFIERSGYVPESIADGTGAYGFNPAYDPAKTVRGDAFEGRDPKYSWLNPGFAQGENEPVVNVTWHDAAALADWLSRSEGVRYRLPTEAEWEYACRAGTSTRYATGDQAASLVNQANLFDSESARHWPKWHANALETSDGFAFTAPVGSFPPNAFGVYDMHGNVWEWVSDWHADDAYANAPLDDPRGPPAGVVKVRRGGSWHTWPFYARCAFRNWNTPETRYTLVGIRLLRESSDGCRDTGTAPFSGCSIR